MVTRRDTQANVFLDIYDDSIHKGMQDQPFATKIMSNQRIFVFNDPKHQRKLLLLF